MAAEPVDVTFVVVRGEVPEVYGGEKSALATASALRGAGFRPRFLVTAGDRFAEEVAAEALECDVVPVGDPFAGLRRAGWRERLGRVGALLRVNVAGARRRPAIVHTAAIPGFYCGWLAARLSGAKLIFHVRGGSRHARTRWFESLAVLLADRTITVSDTLRSELIDGGAAWLRPALGRRVVAVYNGFDFAEIDACLRDVSRAEAQARTGLLPDELNLLLVGGIDIDKGQLRFVEEVLPRVMAELPAARVVFVGGVKDDAYAAACHAALARAGLQGRARFTGYQPREGVYLHYRAADLLVLPSRREGLPRCAIEAGGFGLPVVATRVTGSVEAIRDGASGFLVAPADLAAMAGPIVRLARDPELRRRMGQAGAAHVRERFTLERNVEAIARLYRELLS